MKYLLNLILISLTTTASMSMMSCCKPDVNHHGHGVDKHPHEHHGKMHHGKMHHSKMHHEYGDK